MPLDVILRYPRIHISVKRLFVHSVSLVAFQVLALGAFASDLSCSRLFAVEVHTYADYRQSSSMIQKFQAIFQIRALNKDLLRSFERLSKPDLDSSLNIFERAHLIFKIFLRERVNLLPEIIAREIQLKAERSFDKVIAADLVHGVAAQETGVPELILPREFIRTIHHYRMLVHELEHFIQLEIAPLSINKKLGNKLLNAEISYECESGAMIAESIFLSLFSTNDIAFWQKHLEANNRALNTHNQMYFARVLENAHLSPQQYANQERKNGRNTISIFRQRQRLPY